MLTTTRTPIASFTMETRQTQRMLHLNRREQISLLLALGLFSVCSFPWLSLPGPYQDELLFVQVLEPFAFGSTLYSWTIAGAEIPVMVMTYVGTLKPGFPFWPWHGHRIHPRCAEYHVFSR